MGQNVNENKAMTKVVIAMKTNIVGDTRTRTMDLKGGSQVRIPIYQNISLSDYT